MKFSCKFPGCLYRSSRRRTLIAHQCSSHERRLYPCDKGCGAVLSSRSSLCSHRRSVHGPGRRRRVRAHPAGQHSARKDLAPTPVENIELSACYSPLSTPPLTSNQSTTAVVQSVDALPESFKQFFSEDFGSLMISEKYLIPTGVDYLSWGLPFVEAGNMTPRERHHSDQVLDQVQEPSGIDSLDALLDEFEMPSFEILPPSSSPVPTAQYEATDLQSLASCIDPMQYLTLGEPLSPTAATSDRLFAHSSFSLPYPSPMGASLSSTPTPVYHIQSPASSAALQPSYSSTDPSPYSWTASNINLHDFSPSRHA